VTGRITTLFTHENQLVIGGYEGEGEGPFHSFVRRWTGISWEDMGPSPSLPIFDSGVSRLLSMQGKLVAAWNYGGTRDPYTQLAWWGGSAWNLMGAPFNGYVRGGAEWGGDLYFCGEFTFAGDSPSRLIARWLGGLVPVGTISLSALETESGVILRWTGSIEASAYQVYRDDGDVGSRLAVSTLLSAQDENEYLDAGLLDAPSRYWIKEIQRSGETLWHGPLAVSPAGSRAALELVALHPNPASAGSKVKFRLGKSEWCTATVMDVRGRLVRSIFDGPLGAGWHELSWDGRDDSGHAMSEGFYFVRITSGKFTRTRKLTLMR
jgi:hypothetical protein